MSEELKTYSPVRGEYVEFGDHVSLLATAAKKDSEIEQLKAELAELRERLKPVEYQKYEFCKDVECGAFDNGRCHARQCCYRTAKHFHRWLKQNGYKIIKSVCKKGE